MGQAIAVRRDFTSEEVRQLAKRAKDASQARRLLAIASGSMAYRGKTRRRPVVWTGRRCGTG
jgi:hypothetical protein